MIRGTNATYKFKMPYSFSEIEIAQIVFWQPNNPGPSKDRPLPITKILQQCSPTDDPYEISVTLNQEETLRFSDEYKAYTQFRATTFEGIPIASKKREITVYPVYDDSILDEDILPTPTYDGLVYIDGGTIV